MYERGGDLLLELFQKYGIEYIFCSPGSEWVPKVKELATKAEQVHVLFNNHWRDRAVTNGRQMKLMLD